MLGMQRVEPLDQTTDRGGDLRRAGRGEALAVTRYQGFTRVDRYGCPSNGRSAV
ncbi:hypothetical protein JCM13580A_61250 [Streptomyces drozdowiczii]